MVIWMKTAETETDLLVSSSLAFASSSAFDVEGLGASTGDLATAAALVVAVAVATGSAGSVFLSSLVRAFTTMAGSTAPS